MGDVTAHYAQREQDLGDEVMRDVERQVMLQVIDTRWREHLKEMDYLQEGINLRALGQKDPLTEWQREGFEMFGQLMSTIDREYVQYVMNVQTVEEQAAMPATGLSYSAPDDPSESDGFSNVPVSAGDGEVPATAAEEVAQQPVVKSDMDKTPRNAPCPCGSGKKYKQCHGAA